MSNVIDELPEFVRRQIGLSFSVAVTVYTSIFTRLLPIEHGSYIFGHRQDVPNYIDGAIYVIRLLTDEETFRFFVPYVRCDDGTWEQSTTSYLCGLDTPEHKSELMLCKLKYG